MDFMSANLREAGLVRLVGEDSLSLSETFFRISFLKLSRSE